MASLTSSMHMGYGALYSSPILSDSSDVSEDKRGFRAVMSNWHNASHILTLRPY